MLWQARAVLELLRAYYTDNEDYKAVLDFNHNPMRFDFDALLAKSGLKTPAWLFVCSIVSLKDVLFVLCLECLPPSLPASLPQAEDAACAMTFAAAAGWLTQIHTRSMNAI